MIICEVGIMARGFPLVYSQYHKVGVKKTDSMLKTAYLTGILNYIEAVTFQNNIEYLESNNYIIAFHMDKLFVSNLAKPEIIIAYVIFSSNHKHGLDKLISKNIKPYLFKILKKFKKKYSGVNLSVIHIFAPFKEKIDKIFEIGAKNTENKFTFLLSH